MKRKYISAALAAVMLLSGCSLLGEKSELPGSANSEVSSVSSTQSSGGFSVPSLIISRDTDTDSSVSSQISSNVDDNLINDSQDIESSDNSESEPQSAFEGVTVYNGIEDLSDLTEDEILASHPKIIIPEQTEEPHFDFYHEPPLEFPSSANIKICSLSNALSRFSEIEKSVPHGSPEQIVQTLLERNILCFAALQMKCWTYEGAGSGEVPEEGIIPIISDYIKSVEQANALFENTYTDYIAERLLNPTEVEGYSKLFQENGQGELSFDFGNLRENNNNSFSKQTYAAIISASENEIVFGRFYQSRPNPETEQPNTMYFKAVKEKGRWRLENYITDVPSFKADYTTLIQTGRIGAPELVELAKEQVGNVGGEKYWDWYGFKNRPEWCGVFVSWLYDQAGLNGPFFSMVNSEGMYWYKKNNRWADRGYPDIAPGDCIFYDWELDGAANHVGIVIGTDGKYVYTIEGNREDTCMTRKIELDDERILGYGLMVW